MTSRQCDLIISLAAHPARSNDLGQVRALAGVDRVHIDDHRTWLLISFDPVLISEKSILDQLDRLGVRVASVQSYDDRSS